MRRSRTCPLGLMSLERSAETNTPRRCCVTPYRRREDGVSVLEYVLLVALVAMVSCGTLMYLGRGSGSPAGVANNVANNVITQSGPLPGGQGGEITGCHRELRLKHGVPAERRGARTRCT